MNQLLSFDFLQTKKISHLWADICSFENLLLAYYKARKGKRHRKEVAFFELNREGELLNLQAEMQSLQYQPGEYRQFQIYDKKPRTISAAPFRDRVVHHAIMNCLQPLLESHLYEHCYACRKSMGVHQAVNQYQFWAKRYAYVLKMDVKHYFPTVDHQVLLAQLKKVIDDGELLVILERIINSYPSEQKGKGMAIGNLTSQFFANWYLKGIDAFIAKEQNFPAYLRYVDDFFIFSDNKQSLWDLKIKLENELLHYQQSFHHNKAVVCRTSEKVPVLGYQLSRNRRWLQSANGKKAYKRVQLQAKLCRQGKLEFFDMKSSVSAWVGHAQHGETLGLRTALFSNLLVNKKASSSSTAV